MKTTEDRAAAIALNSCKNFLACLEAGRKPGAKNSRAALRLIRKAQAQHVRVRALLGIA
jgi:hypothetical protein